MTTSPLICQRCGAFGPTMADLQELCQGHAPVVDRMPAVVQPLDASGKVLASFLPPAGTVRLGYGPTPAAAPVIWLERPPPEVLSRQRQFLETAPASSPPRRFFGYSGRPMDDDEVEATLAGSSPSVGFRAPADGPAVDVRELLVPPGFPPPGHEDTMIALLRARDTSRATADAAVKSGTEAMAKASEILRDGNFVKTMHERDRGLLATAHVVAQAVDKDGKPLAILPLGKAFVPPSGAVGVRFVAASAEDLASVASLPKVPEARVVVADVESALAGLVYPLPSDPVVMELATGTQPFGPFLTTPPRPEETVGFSVKMPDKPAPWGPLKVQFQALDCAGNVLASVPAGEQLDPPPGAVGFRYLIDRVEGGDELVVSPSVGFRAPADAPAVDAEALAEVSGPRLFAFSLVKEGGHPMQQVDIAEPEEDEGAPLPSPEHEAAGAVLTLTVNPGHEGRLLFHGADGELLEAAADGVPHAVPVGTDHVKMLIRRKP